MCEKALSTDLNIFGRAESVLDCQKIKRCVLNNDFHIQAFESLSQNYCNRSAVKWGENINVISEDSISQN